MQIDVDTGFGQQGHSSPTRNVTPNSYIWDSFPVPDRGTNWVNGQQLIGRNGDPAKKEGMAMWLFSIIEDMPERCTFSSLDGELLLIPQAGALDIQTELGELMVRQNEICVIPRGVRHRITLSGDQPCRGYICELYQGHFRLPDLGIVGSTGLANVRDFQIPTALFDGSLSDGGKIARADNNEWDIVSRLEGRLWSCTQSHTPFDVAGWHGTCYPYKYDLARFCVLGNALFDEHDPSLFVVLTAPNYAAEPGTAVMDFAVVSPRWNVAEDTYWLPYWHRNTMQEFFGPIISNQSPEYPFSSAKTGHRFAPFAAGLHGSMSTHGATEADYQAAQRRDTHKPAKVQTDGLNIFLVETDKPLALSDWAFNCAMKNPSGRPKI